VREIVDQHTISIHPPRCAGSIASHPTTASAKPTVSSSARRRPSRASFRHQNKWLGAIPWRRAVADTSPRSVIALRNDPLLLFKRPATPRSRLDQVDAGALMRVMSIVERR
jgi:hypothetical protein